MLGLQTSTAVPEIAHTVATALLPHPQPATVPGMPAREHYDQNEGQAQAGAQSLLTMLGGSKHLTAGWVGFATKTLLVSLSSSTVGACGWLLGLTPLFT